MPKLSERDFVLRAQAVHHYRKQHPHANAHQVAKALRLPYHWVRTFMVQVWYGQQSRAHQTFPRRAKSYEDSPGKRDLLDSLRSDPPATQKDAWERMNQYGIKCGPSMVKRYLAKWGLPIPEPTRGPNAKNKTPNKKLEALRSELVVLCMQHPDAVPTALIKELLE